ncbi:MAG: RNA-metabolising metallo-beta-lactamase [Candidatus Nomurabacteria bacterium GW2011_GWF2_35_66]|uniref:RNA-metabolising metallo-beta-lactamase n=1 Tax=Candidatus Nomurabacteria bacterium GW2011_GWE1_35_16 TaxID=1618761 RepID=A0A0G0EEY2_9BACT|nr:MAG: RNA-metabolising metallo-beta-lactamase [Candidatus Nomurabacteria bacterium GW2011_GWF1_34_20]KKP61639.1 MAG: RNA-metabolising metallo-beta-lactamase [Candidatus Nomurabacteria bacterium GW2011_GWE2_34_25]KKP65932.1 MAG: RNA-metabolising metallo-beta-lactamase [Candidatus Nomurabacteria bacterium GW2011_GWE1_35_16]KKP82988.1 MAG: RNA-metabolising metallo-beta-lactamase [Candidatus Nomurabacteria bacterium GW2011_GWF2_35_66]HAE36301.1 MBL fold hydrolase [Candidatus Nomurabacteria bacter
MANDTKLKVTFCSGAGTVTGANFLIEGNGKKFLIDCGLIQGEKVADDLNWEEFPYDASTIDILFITHGHIDHIGRIPKLIHEGFNGRIVSTIPTKEITEIMLADTAHLLARDEEHNLAEIYSAENIKKAMSLWETIEYGQKLNVDHGFQFSFKDSGHILGSGILEIIYNYRKIVFTGDLGNSPSPLLRDTEKIKDVDYLFMESVYGDRNHEDRDIRKQRLQEIINENYNRKGVLIIPTFSLERTQELLYEIDTLVEGNLIPRMPIYLDSPLAIKLTAVYTKYEKYFNPTALKIIKGGNDIFDFIGLKMTEQTEESKAILYSPDPKIIMAGSGMSNGGRILHHEKNYLPNANNTILLIGYQAVGTLGRSIENGAKKIRIMGEDIYIKAHLEMISGYSGHKDSDHLVEFVEGTAKTVKKVFLLMGEPKASMFLAQKLRDNLGLETYTPMGGESVEIEC